MTIGEAAKEARLKKWFSLQDLAERSGVSKNTIYRLETGRSEPSITTVELLADALGISIDEYIGHEVAKKY
jgi:transcriptional regulator with XRE-family HTH domain